MKRGRLAAGAVCCALLSCAVAGGQQDAPVSRLEKLIGEIESLAAAEPPLIGIHAQIEAGRVLRSAARERAARLLRDAANRALQLRDATARGALIPRVVKQYAEVDAEGAEPVCMTLPRRAAESAEDLLADCYGELIGGLKDRGARLEAARRGLAAGAFDTPAYAALLEQAREEQPEAAGVLLAAVVDGIPADANASEIRLLLRILRLHGAGEPALARRGLEKAYEAVRSRRSGSMAREADFEHEVGGRKVETSTVRDALLFQIAGLAEHFAPDLLADRRSPLRQWREEVAGIDAAAWGKYRMREKADAGRKDEELELGEPRIQLPEIQGMRPDDVVSLARRQKDPRVKVELLLDMLDEAKDLSGQRRVSIAWEALQETAKMNYKPMRLVAQSMLTRRLYLWGEPQKAGVGAQMLAETFDRMFNCAAGGCETLSNPDELPGEVVQSFAEYLKENRIEPEELGLSHRSLRLYWLILELEEELKEKKE